MTPVADFVLQRASEWAAGRMQGCPGNGIRTGTGVQSAGQKCTEPDEHLAGRHP